MLTQTATWHKQRSYIVPTTEVLSDQLRAVVLIYVSLQLHGRPLAA